MVLLHLSFSLSFLVECNKLGEKEKRRRADLEKTKTFHSHRKMSTKTSPSSNALLQMGTKPQHLNWEALYIAMWSIFTFGNN
jgi:hypothetical protein